MLYFLLQDLVEQVLIVEWFLTTPFVAVHQDTQETPWNLVELHPLLNQWIQTLVTLIHVVHTVRNMSRMGIVSVPVCQDTKELHQIVNLNVLSALIVV